MAGLSEQMKAFADGVLAGKNRTQAYRDAGYSPKQASTGARRLYQLECVQVYLREQQRIKAAIEEESIKLAIERTAITKEKVARELSLIGFANMLDYMTVGPNGDPMLDFSKVTRDQAAALVEVTVEDFLDGRGADARDVRKVKFKLADKRQSLMDIAKLFGWIIEKREQKNVSDLEKMTDAELDAEIARLDAKRLAAQAGGIGAWGVN